MAHFKLGLALGEQGQFDEAIVACRRAMELKPDDPDAHYSLGISLGNTGRLDEAVAAYRKAIALQARSCRESLQPWARALATREARPGSDQPGAWPRAGLATQGLALSVGRVGARMPPAARGRGPAAITHSPGSALRFWQAI